MPGDRRGRARAGLEGPRRRPRHDSRRPRRGLRPRALCGVPIAIEPMHPMYAADRGCINTLAQALDLCDELDGKNGAAIGVAVDVYHVWWDPQLKAQIERAGEKRLFGFHLCDWLVPTTDFLLDRGMMGDGVIDIPLIRSWMEGAGYHGMHEVEIFSRNNWWKKDADEVLITCKWRHETSVWCRSPPRCAAASLRGLNLMPRRIFLGGCCRRDRQAARIAAPRCRIRRLRDHALRDEGRRTGGRRRQVDRRRRVRCPGARPRTGRCSTPKS